MDPLHMYGPNDKSSPEMVHDMDNFTKYLINAASQFYQIKRWVMSIHKSMRQKMPNVCEWRFGRFRYLWDSEINSLWLGVISALIMLPNIPNPASSHKYSSKYVPKMTNVCEWSFWRFIYLGDKEINSLWLAVISTLILPSNISNWVLSHEYS